MTIAVADEIVDAEIVPTADEARASIDRARTHAQGFWAEVKWQVESNAWEALGYESLDQMWDAEYMALNVGIARSDRPELVASFRKAGQTQQQIADKLNVARTTVLNDLRDVNVKNDNEPPATVTNSRGQERPATYARPAPANVNTDTGEIDPEPEATDNEREATFVNDLRLYILHVGNSKETKALSRTGKEYLIAYLREAARNIEETL